MFNKTVGPGRKTARSTATTLDGKEEQSHALGGFVSLKKADIFLDPVQRKLLGFMVVFIVIAVINSVSRLVSIEGVPAGTIAFVLLITLITYTFGKRRNIQHKSNSVDIIVNIKFVQKVMSQFNIIGFTITTTSFILIIYAIIVEIIIFTAKRGYSEAYGIEFISPLLIVILLIPVLIGFKLKAMKSKVIIYFLIATSILIEFISHTIIKLLTLN